MVSFSGWPCRPPRRLTGCNIHTVPKICSIQFAFPGLSSLRASCIFMHPWLSTCCSAAIPLLPLLLTIVSPVPAQAAAVAGVPSRFPPGELVVPFLAPTVGFHYKNRDLNLCWIPSILWIPFPSTKCTLTKGKVYALCTHLSVHLFLG